MPIACPPSRSEASPCSELLPLGPRCDLVLRIQTRCRAAHRPITNAHDDDDEEEEEDEDADDDEDDENDGDDGDDGGGDDEE